LKNRHPITEHQIHVFERVNYDGSGINAIARFWPYDSFPIFFAGSTPEKAIEAAEKFRAETVEKHEAAYLARESARAAREAAKKAKAAKEPA